MLRVSNDNEKLVRVYFTEFSIAGLLRLVASPTPLPGKFPLLIYFSDLFKSQKASTSFSITNWPPDDSGFTSVVSSCSNTHTGNFDFGNNFGMSPPSPLLSHITFSSWKPASNTSGSQGCSGPCNHGSGDVFNVFALNSYVGNNNGHLAC